MNKDNITWQYCADFIRGLKGLCLTSKGEDLYGRYVSPYDTSLSKEELTAYLKSEELNNYFKAILEIMEPTKPEEDSEDSEPVILDSILGGYVRHISGFKRFILENKATVRQNNPKMKVLEISKELKRLWDDLPEKNTKTSKGRITFKGKEYYDTKVYERIG